MKVIISNQSELPIYAQIREQIKEQILNRQIEEGTVLPSIRQLAKELGISVITTTRAYNDLESEGFIVSVQGKGSIVQRKDNELLREQYIKKIEDSMETAISTGRLVDLTNEDLLMIFNNLLENR